MHQPKVVAFSRMQDGSRADYALVDEFQRAYERGLPNRLLAAPSRLDEGESWQGFKESRLTHSLQTATRAENDGADVDTIVGAVLHDIGDELAPRNHSQLAASILRPYVRPEVTWVVEHHGLFQMQYYAEHLGLDPHGHLAYRDHKWFQSCQGFCERWDQTSFDPDYATQPLRHFEGMLREVFGRKAFGA